jgi:hypothetical protein
MKKLSGRAAVLNEFRNMPAIEIKRVPGISANPTLRLNKQDTDLQELAHNVDKGRRIS